MVNEDILLTRIRDLLAQANQLLPAAIGGGGGGGTIVSCPPFYIPRQSINTATTGPAFGTLTLLTSRKIALIFEVPKTGNIRKLHWRPNSVTTPTDTDVRLETVDPATGDASGALVSANANATVLSAAVIAGAWLQTQLTADAPVTKGQTLAIVIVPTGVPNYTVTTTINPDNTRFPYNSIFSGTWTKTGVSLCCAVEYDDGSFAYMPFNIPASAVNNHDISNATTPDEIALKFKVAAPMRVSGWWQLTDLDGDADVVLYDSDGATPLLSRSIDKDIRAALSPGTGYTRSFLASVELLADTFYYLAIKPTSATTLRAYSFDVAAAPLLDITEGGQNFHYAQRAAAGAWTPTLTRRPFLGLMIDGIAA